MRSTVVLAAILAGCFVAEAATFDMLSCCPGEDNAREARFVWHSDSDSCLFFLAKASDTAGAHRILPHRKTEKPVTFRNDDVTYYKYEVDISGLAPGTEYVYWVESGGESSIRQKFRSAGTSGSWNFLWMGDVHAHPEDAAKMTSVSTLIANAKDAAGILDFILFSGDWTKYGGRYDNWQQYNGNPAMTDYMLAMIPGNKEYYYNGKQTGVNGTSNRIHNKWFLACRNNPPNGADGIDSSYWFIRDGVMFVGIDTIAEEGVDMDTAVYNNAFMLQTNWFDNVVTSQRGKFRYLVVFQHYPYFTYSGDAGFKYGYGHYKKWKNLFDKHKVDFALAGDHHNYCRSKALHGGSESVDGTVYVTCPEIGKSLYSPSVKAASNLDSYGVTSGDNPTVKTLMATAHNGDESVGAIWFSVSPEKMSMHYIGISATAYDTCEVPPKDRGFEYVGPTVDQGPWLYECAANSSRTGIWSQDVAYGADGRAYVFNGTFTPYSASTGNIVTVETTVQFCEDTEDRTPDATAQAAVRLSTNGCFQVWTSEKLGVESGGVGELVWVDVEAEGVTPASGAEYTLRTKFDYTAGTYSVEVKSADAWQPLKLTASTSHLSSPIAHLSSSFPLAAAANRVTSIGFVGDTLFTSMLANCAVVATGFAADEKIALAGATNVLSAARALWLNSLGDRATVASAASSLTEKKFSDAYLLNFDITKGNFTYTFEITGIKVLSDSVKVDVTLVRNGVTKGAINGALNFYGAATLDAFKSGGALVGTATLAEDAFDGGEKASATFDKDGNAFYNVKIEEQ